MAGENVVKENGLIERAKCDSCNHMCVYAVPEEKGCACAGQPECGCLGCKGG